MRIKVVKRRRRNIRRGGYVLDRGVKLLNRDGDTIIFLGCTSLHRTNPADNIWQINGENSKNGFFVSRKEEGQLKGLLFICGKSCFMLGLKS